MNKLTIYKSNKVWFWKLEDNKCYVPIFSKPFENQKDARKDFTRYTIVHKIKLYTINYDTVGVERSILKRIWIKVKKIVRIK